MRTFTWSDLAFCIALVGTLILFSLILAPFLGPLIFSMFVVILVFPVYARVVRWLGGRRRLASLGVSLGVVLAVIAPSVVVVFLLVERGIQVFTRLSELIAEGRIQEALGAIGPHLEPLFTRMGQLGVLDAVREVASNLAATLSSQLAPAVAAVGNLVIGAFIVIIGLYYLLLDGDELVRELVDVTPIERSYSKEIAGDLSSVLRSLFLASFLTAVGHGLLGGLAFWIVGLPNVLFWAALMAFFALLPIVGSALVWAPAGIWLLLQGRVLAGVFVLLFGFVVLGFLDAVIRPLVARAAARLHPLIVLLTLFGGLELFGPLGALLGPLIGALTVACSRVWSRDVRPQVR